MEANVGQIMWESSDVYKYISGDVLVDIYLPWERGGSSP